MARDYTAANTDLTSWGDVLDDHEVDWSLFFWTFPEGTTNTGYVASKFIVDFEGFFVRRDGGDASQWTIGIADNSAGNSVNLGAASVISDTWQAIIATLNDTGSDDAGVLNLWRDNTANAESTTADRIGASTNAFGVGNRASDLARSFEGGVAEVAWWRDYVLTAADRAVLQAGYSPLFIHPLPTLYWPMIRETTDIITATAAVSDTSDVRDHPNIIYPTSTPIQFPVAAVGGANPKGPLGMPFHGPFAGPIGFYDEIMGNEEIIRSAKRELRVA